MVVLVQLINLLVQNVLVSLLLLLVDEELVDEELCEVFIEEVGEVLEIIGCYLLVWKVDYDDCEVLIEVCCVFYIFKGSGWMVCVLVIGELVWLIENLFNCVFDCSIVVSELVQ